MTKRINTTLDGRNKIREGLAAWLRTLSLGLFAVAIIEPLRTPDTSTALTLSVGIGGVIVILVLSCAILSGIEERT